MPLHGEQIEEACKSGVRLSNRYSSEIINDVALDFMDLCRPLALVVSVLDSEIRHGNPFFSYDCFTLFFLETNFGPKYFLVIVTCVLHCF